jgi:predicted PurR-regulated permease PerM
MNISRTFSQTDPKTLQWIQYIVLISVVLFFGRDIFIPISFALLISFVLYPICRWMETKGAGRLTAIIISLCVLILIGLMLFALLVSQFVAFAHEWPHLQVKLNQSFIQFGEYLRDVFNITKDQQTDFVAKITDNSGKDVLQVVKGTISASAVSVVILILIPVYAVLILYYRRYWMKVLIRLFPHERVESLNEIISLTIKAYYNFIKGMALVYLVVGSLNSIGLLLLGVPHAILFGFIASILTFIPYVGIIVGSLLPITMAWITYDSVWYPVGIVGIFAFVQYLEANVIFPIAVSSRLNVNTFAMLLAIFVGGILWGMAGMILFVPFVGILKLIADHNPKWKTLSMVLGMENGINKKLDDVK